jgi:hypothetical protein
MTRSSAEIEREVEDARGRIDQTVEALKDKMQPKELFDEATRMMSGASNRVLTTAVEQLKENPIPIALIGLGVAWLAIAQTRKPRAQGTGAGDGYFPTYEGYDEDEGVRAKVRAKAEAAKARLARTAETARSRLSAGSQVAGEGVTDAKARAAEFAGAARAKAGEYGDYARRKFDDTLEAEPLVIGALGLAVGAAIGAALPSTPAERRYFGPARSKAAEAAKAQLGQVRDVASRAYGQIKDELHRQTGPDGDGASLAEKASSIAGAGARTVRDEIAGSPH